MSQKKLLGAGLISAIAASLCCITPFLALVAGTTGAAASFSWVAPMRPYFIGLTVLVLALAWWQKLKPAGATTDTCGCAVKTPFLQSKAFLGIVTVISVVMLTFPLYAHLLYHQNKNSGQVNLSALETIQFEISGMTCRSCEEHIKTAVDQLHGIAEVEVSYEKASAVILYDTTKQTAGQIKSAINSTGYLVISP